jgi:UDP-N-acetylmuramate--alanine ligase
LWADFADAFEGAHLLVITDIYAAGERPRPGVTGKLIVNAVLDTHPWRHVAYLPRRRDLAPYLRSVLRPGDLCLTLGAGDLTTLPDLWLADALDD